MAFDFLGNPKEADLIAFEAFLTSELDTLDRKVANITSNIDRLKMLRERVINEFKTRGISIPIDFGGERQKNSGDTETEAHIYDIDPAVWMLKAKEPVIEAIKYKQENLENYMKRVFYAITKEEEKLIVLNQGKTAVLGHLTTAKGLIQKFNLLKKEKKNEPAS